MLKTIKSDKFALLLTMLAVVVLFPNVFYMAYKVAGDMPIPGLRIIQSFLIGLYVSWSIVYFTIKGDQRTAYGFAVFEMLISFFYYWNRLLWEGGHFHMNWYIIPAILIAVFLPWSVKSYANNVTTEQQPSGAHRTRLAAMTDEEFIRYLEETPMTVPAPGRYKRGHESMQAPAIPKLTDIERKHYEEALLHAKAENKELAERILRDKRELELANKDKAWLKDLIKKNEVKILPEESVRISQMESTEPQASG